MAEGKAQPIRRLNPPELGSPPGYSQIVDVRASRIIFIAGQTALDRHGALVGKNDFPAQAEQVFRNLNTALLSVGCTASNLAKLTVFLRDMGHLSAYKTLSSVISICYAMFEAFRLTSGYFEPVIAGPTGQRSGLSPVAGGGARARLFRAKIPNQ
jgi:enamine deaminase RidA (YjgF/YER057c/UK114 family)